VIEIMASLPSVVLGFLAAIVFAPVVRDRLPAVIAAAATGVVFVIGSEMTSRKAARLAIQQLDHGHPRFLGAVLNRVELERNAYYYSGYYKRDYVKYYQAAAR